VQTTTTPTIFTTPMQPKMPTDVPLDQTNPLIWILVFATLCTATEKPLNAIANLLRVIAPFVLNRKRPRQ
jgi:hypothetical protein